MKLIEKLIYSGVLFLIVYVVVSLTLRLFEFTSVYVSHMVGGIGATVAGVLLFMYLLMRK
jgi:hypothetical protein